MDAVLHDFPNSIDEFGFNHGSSPVCTMNSSPPLPSTSPESSPPCSADSGPNCSEFDFVSDPACPMNPNSSDSPLILENLDLATLGLDLERLSDQTPYPNLVLSYINEMLMDETMEEQHCMLQDCLALQAAEKAFYETLVDDCPPSVRQNAEENPDDYISGSRTSSLEDSIERTSLVSDSSSNSWGSFTPESQLWRSRGRKNDEREDGDDFEEERSNKQSAFSLDDSEQSGMFDDVLLLNLSDLLPSVDRKSKNKGSKRSTKSKKKEEAVDLWSLLLQCAQAISTFDYKNAAKLLKQIKQHSSDSGAALQRLAHYFASGLETRLAGLVAPAYSPMVSNLTSAAEILKAYKVYVMACPFTKMSGFFTNRSIRILAEKAATLHVVDFGISYGFQWPCLIQRISEWAGGPPKLRITGIELPQPGFRPEQRVEETGHRLRRFAERFNIPFEYNVIAKKWETIQLEELKLGKDEVTVVTCMYRFRHLPDDTVVTNSARDAVLKLVKDIKPDLFIHGVLSGTYNSPFFATRFKEALYHYSGLFDMFETNIVRKDQQEQRMRFEKEVYGRDILNVVACDGIERVERPETYKQWQSRNQRAGLKQISLDQELVKMIRTMVKSSYDKNFVIDVDRNWLLQGWKGRAFYALSMWKPAQ